MSAEEKLKKNIKAFLEALTDSTKTPHVSDDVRFEAHQILQDADALNKEQIAIRVAALTKGIP